MTQSEARRRILREWRALPNGGRDRPDSIDQFVLYAADRYLFRTRSLRYLLVRCWIGA